MKCGVPAPRAGAREGPVPAPAARRSLAVLGRSGVYALDERIIPPASSCDGQAEGCENHAHGTGASAPPVGDQDKRQLGYAEPPAATQLCRLHEAAPFRLEPAVMARCLGALSRSRRSVPARRLRLARRRLVALDAPPHPDFTLLGSRASPAARVAEPLSSPWCSDGLPEHQAVCRRRSSCTSSAPKRPTAVHAAVQRTRVEVTATQPTSGAY